MEIHLKKTSQILFIGIMIFFIALSAFLISDKINRNDPNPEDSGVIMTIQNVTPTGLTYTLENPTDREYGTGIDHERILLYVHKNGSWELLEPTDVRDGGLFRLFLNPHSKETHTVNWEHFHGELPPGDYKFQKEILYTYPIRYVVEREFSLP
ncbi:MAG: hypothetical protein LBU81_03900 [Methanosarcinales archaeon]|jgi:hypothetical protein|nr:hypothetical protein [Methanosarcinales archaeon]